MNGDQVAMESKANLTAEASERPARFGFPTYSTDVQVQNNGQEETNLKQFKENNFYKNFRTIPGTLIMLFLEYMDLSSWISEG